MNLFLRAVVCLLILFTLLIPQEAAAQNECAVATPLTLYTGACGGATAGTTIGATQSLVGCAGDADDDVWYSFVPNGGTTTITVTGTGIINPVIEVFSGGCGALTSVICQNASATNNESVALTNLSNGSTYYVRVYSLGLGAGQGTFNICVTRNALPANDNCSGATLLTPNNTCVNTGGNLNNASNSGIPAGACGGTTDDDVWFRFVAVNNTQMITVRNIQANIAVTGAGLGGSAIFEVFSSSDNTCTGAFTSIGCGTVVGTDLMFQHNGYTIGNTYYIRVYSTNSIGLTATTNFNICVTNPPTNNNCSGATSITPAATCAAGSSMQAGTLVNASNSGIAATCAGTPDDDVWFSFVAQFNGQLVTLRNLGTNIATTGAGLGGVPIIEVFSSSDNTCTGTLTSMGCGTITGTDVLFQSSTYVPGNTYFIRVYSTNNVPLYNNATFNVCVTNPPANNDCAGATSLVPAATCATGAGGSQAAGTLVNATNSGLAAGCGGTADDDVWFTFVAQYTTQTVTVSGLGANIAVSGAGLGGSAVLEVFSSSDNTCSGTLTTIACGNVSGANLVAYANSLTVGNTYYARVYSTNAVGLITAANFNLCVTNPPITAPITFFGKSFINITKGTGGGTVEPGDILEIRAGVTVRPTSMLDSCGFFDNIPAGTTYIPGSLAVLTNEGKVYKSFTDAAGDDAGWITAGAISINMGYNTYDNVASATRKGRIRSGHIPTVSGSCVMIASYRVQVTAPLNTMINLGGGTFTYALITAPTTVINQNYNQNPVMVYTNTGLCANSTGVNVLDNSISGDFNGTFGSGNTMNRVASPNVPPGYAYVDQTGSRPGDFTYTVTNNMSNNAAGFSTNNAWPKPESPAVHRIFGVWDVIGDHTGAADPLAGNPAADTTNGGTGGYMLLVNAAYNLDTVFKYPISGLCPNTYYEISFWVRNVCSRCGVDSVGRGASGISVPAGYIPTDVGDSSGVYPNLSFSIDGVNHYTTGNMRYTGQWVQKGFVFRTGATQTNIEFAIANNAPGGGGNDWALDDISIATCTPNLNLVPSGNAQVCYGNPVNMSCDVVSFFNNYVYYQWQVSHDQGATWSDTLSMGTGVPVLSGGSYVYTANFPTFLGDSSQHLKQYRIRVATTPVNLYDGCSFSNSTNIIVMINNCLNPLSTDIVSFDGLVKDKHAVLNWKTVKQSEITLFEVEKSIDGTNYFRIGTVKGAKNKSDYSFTDPDALNPMAYYRITIVERGNSKKSGIKMLSTSRVPYQLVSVVNPFRTKLNFDLSIPQNSLATIVLTDQYGKVVRLIKQQVMQGSNIMVLDNLGALAGGTYILQVSTQSGTITRKVVKVSN